MLDVSHISKYFDDICAVDDLSFQIKPGQILGLVGPNGAGKTTTIRMVLQIIRPDSGEIILNGTPRSKVKRSQFGYLPEERGLYLRARVLDLLTYFGLLNHLSRHRAEVEAIRMLDRFDMIEYTQKRIHELSKGMQQKLQFIAASLHDPDVIILDEPFTGLDPVNQIVLRDLIDQFRQEGKIILLSSHQMSEIEKLCHHICLINQGKCILAGTMKEIRSRFREESYYIELKNNLSAVHEIDFIEIIEEDNKGCKFRITGKSDETKSIQRLFEKLPITKFYQIEPTLHEIFINMVQKEKS